MKTLTNFIKLDLQTIKPYLTDKRLLIYVALAVILPYGNKAPSSAIAMVLVFTMLIGTYPFAISDQNNLDTLYVAVNINRKQVVIGRYVTTLIINIVGIVIGIGLYVLLSLFMKLPINVLETLFLTSLLFIFITLSQAFQFPFFFKNGYLKSKAITYLPFALISLIILGLGQLYESRFKHVIESSLLFLNSNSLLTVIIVIVFWGLAIFISYKFSHKYYSTKEL